MMNITYLLGETLFLLISFDFLFSSKVTMASYRIQIFFK